MTKTKYAREALPADHRVVRYYGKPAWIERRSRTDDSTETRCVVEGMRPGRFVWECNPRTDLNTCEVCGLRSTPHQVNYKGLGEKTLCMSCWNRIRPCLKRALKLDAERLELNRSIRQLKVVMTNENHDD